jgi:uncharacterized protein (DUF488 family)
LESSVHFDKGGSNSERKFYTLGTSTRGKEEFIEILKHYGIDLVVDVRSFPRSRFEHFVKEELMILLEREAISYIYLGKELGGFRKGGYEKYMENPLYKEGIRILENEAKERIPCIICAERLPWKCHRRFIGMTLKAMGFNVIHIVDKGRIWNPSQGGNGYVEKGGNKEK